MKKIMNLIKNTILSKFEKNIFNFNLLFFEITKFKTQNSIGIKRFY